MGLGLDSSWIQGANQQKSSFKPPTHLLKLGKKIGDFLYRISVKSLLLLSKL